MTLNFERIKPIIFLIALIFSCLFAIHFFTSFATTAAQVIVFGGIGVFVDVVAQFTLSLGKMMWRQKKRVKSVFSFIPYTTYIIIFAIPAAIGYCTTTFNLAEQADIKQQLVDSYSQRQLRQVTNRIDILNKQLDAEADTGYGSRSKVIMAELEKLVVGYDSRIGSLW
jgi:hypothetical protein